MVDTDEASSTLLDLVTIILDDGDGDLGTARGDEDDTTRFFFGGVEVKAFPLLCEGEEETLL